MKNSNLTIVGAGLTGLLAAHAWPNAQIIDAAAGPKKNHKALLRFRTDACAKLTGIEFARVQVRKGIFFQGKFREPNPAICNLYSRKVVGRIVERSIWNMAPSERFIAPEDFYEQLIGAIGKRIHWNATYKPAKDAITINTAPIAVMLAQHPPRLKGLAFNHHSINVRRWRIPGAKVFQTVYFPDPETTIYRASITGDLLTVEEMGTPNTLLEPAPLLWCAEAFGLDAEALEPLDSAEQSFGKVEELPEQTRKQLLYDLTARHGVYSLGRFATWRNVMLDDVVNDIAVIKRLIKANSAYDARKEAL